MKLLISSSTYSCVKVRILGSSLALIPWGSKTRTPSELWLSVMFVALTVLYRFQFLSSWIESKFCMRVLELEFIDGII